MTGTARSGVSWDYEESGGERGENEGPNRKRTRERERERERETNIKELGNEDKCKRGIRGVR